MKWEWLIGGILLLMFSFFMIGFLSSISYGICAANPDDYVAGFMTLESYKALDQCQGYGYSLETCTEKYILVNCSLNIPFGLLAMVPVIGGLIMIGYSIHIPKKRKVK